MGSRVREPVMYLIQSTVRCHAMPPGMRRQRDDTIAEGGSWRADAYTIRADYAGAETFGKANESAFLFRESPIFLAQPRVDPICFPR